MVVAESWANAKTALAIEVLVDPCAGIFVYHEMSSDWSYGGDILVKGAMEVCPR